MSLPSLPSFGRGPRVLVPLLAAIGGVGAVALIVAGQSKVQQLQQMLLASQQQIAALEAEHQELGQRFQDLQGQRDKVDKQVASLRDQMTAAGAELERSKASLGEVEERYRRLNEERTELARQVAGLTKEREEATEQLKRLEQDNVDLRRSATGLRERFTLLDRDYRVVSDKLKSFEQAQQGTVMGLSSSAVAAASVLASPGETPPAMVSPGGVVELPPIVVRKDQAGMAVPVRGRIVEVSEGHNFVVVDKGSLDGIRMGMTLNIVRGSANVGRVSVIRARANMSACDIVRSGTPGPLQVGDLAVQGSP